MTLADLYRSATPTQLWAGREWYRGAADATLRLIADAGLYECPDWRDRAAALVALLSPRCAWRTNVRRALACAEASWLGLDPGSVPGLFQRVRPKVRELLGQDAPPSSLFFDADTAPKTWSFFHNLRGDLRPVTVDVWAARAAGYDPSVLRDPEAYRGIERMYQDAAEEVFDEPASVQAVVWCVTRGANGVLQPAPRWFGLPATVE